MLLLPALVLPLVCYQLYPFVTSIQIGEDRRIRVFTLFGRSPKAYSARECAVAIEHPGLRGPDAGWRLRVDVGVAVREERFTEEKSYKIRLFSYSDAVLFDQMHQELYAAEVRKA